MAKKKSAKGTTIIRKEEVIEGGHHGGAWKVAYADFVTAMMAFFLLMWLLNATTEEQRRGIADYFSPSATLASSKSGSGQPLSGKSPFEDGEALSDKGAITAMNAKSQPTDADDDGSEVPAARVVHEENAPQADATGVNATRQTGQQAAQRASRQAGQQAGQPPAQQAGGPRWQQGRDQPAAETARRQEQADFQKAAQAIQKAVQTDPDLAPLARQLTVELTPEGLRVQLRDSDNLPMFQTGSAEPNPRAAAVLKKLTPILLPLHEPISISGYTDAQPYAGSGRTNWDLSADRANATRRLLTESGLPDARIKDVTGHGDRDLLVPAEPEAAANRRIAILLARTAPVLPLTAPAALPPGAADAVPDAVAGPPAARAPAASAAGKAQDRAAVPPAREPAPAAMPAAPRGTVGKPASAMALPQAGAAPAKANAGTSALSPAALRLPPPPGQAAALRAGATLHGASAPPPG